MRIFRVLGLLALLCGFAAVAQPVLYDDRADFELQLEESITDSYGSEYGITLDAKSSTPVASFGGYSYVDLDGNVRTTMDLDEVYAKADWAAKSPFVILTDAEMSGVLGEVNYVATAFVDTNIVAIGADGSYYCAGCNGSFELRFGTTSVGTAWGVTAVGFVIGMNALDGTDQPFVARVFFEDGTETDYPLPVFNASQDDSPPPFVGWTSPDNRILRIRVGDPGGETKFNGNFQLLSLTFGQARPSVVEEVIFSSSFEDGEE